MSIFDWFFSKEEKEYYVSPLELLEDRIEIMEKDHLDIINSCLLYTSPSPRDQRGSRMPSSA